MGQRMSVTIKFDFDLDQVPGWGDTPEDWIKLIQREFLRQKHYNASCEVLSIEPVTDK